MSLLRWYSISWKISRRNRKRQINTNNDEREQKLIDKNQSLAVSIAWQAWSAPQKDATSYVRVKCRPSAIRSILKVHVNPEAKPTSMVKTFRGNIGGFSQEKGIFHPEGALVLEDLFAGDTINWPFFHAEIHYVLKGKTEISYMLPPWYDERKTITVIPGDAYLVPKGTDVTFKVAHGKPHRHIAIAMPPEPIYSEVPPKNAVQIKYKS